MFAVTSRSACADAKPEDQDDAKPSLAREFKRLVKRLVKEDACELPAVDPLFLAKPESLQAS